MNEEIAMRTLAYLITHYKEHDETIINLEEIQAIEFLQQENARLKDKFKDLEEWLEAMASMYEDEYKDVNASEHYKCMLHKLKEN